MEGELVNLVEKNGTLVVIGETGSGKTTRKLTLKFVFSFSISYTLKVQAGEFSSCIMTCLTSFWIITTDVVI